jgi:uncharacterized iron-regulated protein
MPHTPPVPQITRRRFGGALLAACSGGCASLPAPADGIPPVLSRDTVTRWLLALGRSELLLLGEQHDAPEHQVVHRLVIEALAEAGELAGVVLEMADAGHSTEGLPRQASAAQVQQALAWREGAWPWAAYGPAVQAAVAAGVPVLGGNLPRTLNAQTLRDAVWDTRVPASVLATQRQAVEAGHCGLLPREQLAPMARIQIARDHRMAQVLAQAIRPGQTVLLLTGSRHAERQTGVPLHLPPALQGSPQLKTVRLAAGGAQPGDTRSFDAVWPTASVPSRDHCAELRQRLGG